MNFGRVGDILNVGHIGLCGYYPDRWEEIASLIEECSYLLYYELTPPVEYARARTKSRRDVCRPYKSCMYGYIRVSPRNLPYMRRPH